MAQLINLCGKAIHLEDIVSFSMSRRNYIFVPCFQEIAQASTSRSFLGKETTSVRMEYRFVKNIPYGVVLGEKETPCLGDSYAFKTVGEIIGLDLFKGVKKVAGDAAHMAVRALKLNTSINQKYRILVDGKDLKERRYDEIPAKLIYSDGRKVDVYKNSKEHILIGQEITPYEEPVPVLEVFVSKSKKYMFFGNGIDIDNVEEIYQSLLTAYNMIHDRVTEKKKVLGKINIPKIEIGAIRLQSPFVIQKKENVVDEKPNEEDKQDEY